MISGLSPAARLHEKIKRGPAANILREDHAAMSVPNAVMKHSARKKHTAPEELQPALRKAVGAAVRQYLKDMNGHDPDALYRLVLSEVEAPLVSEVLRHSDGNLTRASDILGINRATLRKKIRQYRLD